VAGDGGSISIRFPGSFLKDGRLRPENEIVLDVAARPGCWEQAQHSTRVQYESQVTPAA